MKCHTDFIICRLAVLCVLVVAAGFLAVASYAVEPPPEILGEKVVTSPNGYFQILSNCDDKFIMDQAGRLDLFYDEFVKEYSHSFAIDLDKNKKLPCRIFKSYDDYSKFFGKIGLDVPDTGQFVFYDKYRYVAAFRTERNRAQNLFRETAHQLFYELLQLRNVPVWCSEGLAEYWGESRIVNGSMVFGTLDPQKIPLLKWRLKENKLIPLEELLNGKRFDYTEAQVFVHYMLMQKSGLKKTLIKFLQACKDNDEKEKNKIVERLVKLEDKWHKYILAGAEQDWESVWETWRYEDNELFCSTRDERCGLALNKEIMPGKRKRYEIACEVKNASDGKEWRGALVVAYLGKENFVVLELEVTRDKARLRLIARARGEWRLLSVMPVDYKHIREDWNKLVIRSDEYGLHVAVNGQETDIRDFTMPEEWRCGISVNNSTSLFRNFTIE